MEMMRWELIEREQEREMIKDLYEAVEKSNAFEILKDYKNLFDPRLQVINEHVTYSGHSGFSFGWTLRQVQYIAEHGIEKYAALVASYS